MTQVVGIFRGSEKGEEHIALDNRLQWFSSGPITIRGTQRYALVHREAMMPIDSDSGPSAADRALSCLATFRDRSLPAFWRRVSSWWGLPPGRREELAQDLEQELALDCLEHSGEILKLPERARHQRWLRLAQQKLYQLHGRQARRGSSSELLESLHDARGSEAERPLGELDLDAAQRALLARLLAGAEYQANGRLSIRSTARNSGIHPVRLKQLWASIAAKLGQDQAWLEDRCRRLAALLCAIAGSLLQRTPALDPLPAPTAPTTEHLHLRLQRMLRSLDGRPLPPALFALRRRLRGRTADALALSSPRDLCTAALTIRPDDPAAALWLAEAERQSGDLSASLAALRLARSLGVARVASSVTRARLLADRGCSAAARSLLERTRQSSGPDPRIRRALEELRDTQRATRRFAPSRRGLTTERERHHGA